MDHYQGAVLYLDILGISELTRKKIKLTTEDYEAWGFAKRSVRNEHFFCAKLLVTFRSCLKAVNEKHENIQLSQLSDCAFIWSKDASVVANAALDLMWMLIHAGIFCRGGIAYGEIIEPAMVAKSLGQFVLGEAVTMAVQYEGKGKGCRLFTGPDLAQKLTGTGPRNQRFPVCSFAELHNPLSGETADEFRWYAQGRLGRTAGDDQTRHQELLELLAVLMYSPRFGWNASSDAGKMQLACSIASISQATRKFLPTSDTVFGVDYLMASPMKRADAVQEKVLKIWTDQASRAFAHKKLIGR